MRNGRYETRDFYGDCLGGIGFPVHGGKALIDTEAEPQVFDVVWCSNAITGSVTGCFKQIIKTGEHPVVHTQYENGKRNYAFNPEEIYGVVIKAMDEQGNVVWERPEPVEVRQVVLCKNCKYLVKEDEHELWCNGFCQPARLVAPDDYCSRGKRKGENEL